MNQRINKKKKPFLITRLFFMLEKDKKEKNHMQDIKTFFPSFLEYIKQTSNNEFLIYRKLYANYKKKIQQQQQHLLNVPISRFFP